MFLFIHMMILLNSWHASRENYIFWTFLINCPCHVSHKHKWADSWTYPLSPYLSVIFSCSSNFLSLISFQDTAFEKEYFVETRRWRWCECKCLLHLALISYVQRFLNKQIGVEFVPNYGSLISLSWPGIVVSTWVYSIVHITKGEWMVQGTGPDSRWAGPCYRYKYVVVFATCGPCFWCSCCWSVKVDVDHQVILSWSALRVQGQG